MLLLVIDYDPCGNYFNKNIFLKVTARPSNICDMADDANPLIQKYC